MAQAAPHGAREGAGAMSPALSLSVKLALTLLAFVFYLIAMIPVAYGWTVETSPDGGVQMRASVDDTASCTFTVYTESVANTTPQTAQYGSAFTVTQTNLAIDVPGGVYSVALPVVSSVLRPRYNLVVVKRGTVVEEKHVIYIPAAGLPVAVQGSVPVSAPAALPVSLDSTLAVSLSETMPVTVSGIGPAAGDEVLAGLVGLGVFCCGFMFMGAVKR